MADPSGGATTDPPGNVVVDATGMGTGFLLNRKVGVRIEGFVVLNAATGIYVRTRSDQAVIANNVVTGCSRNGIYIQDSKNVLVFNNLLYANGRTGVLITGDTTGSAGACVVNNTVYANGNRGIFFAGTSVTSPGGLVVNNIVQGNAVAGIQVNEGSLPGFRSGGNVTADRFAHGTPVDPTDRVGDAAFLNPMGRDGILGGQGYADDDFRLFQGDELGNGVSPAVDAGVDSARNLRMARSTTRADGRPDRGWVDAGYHYGNRAAPSSCENIRLLRFQSLYVDSIVGEDRNDGLSRSRPRRSLGDTLARARPGQRVVVLGHISEGGLTFGNSGREGREVVLHGVPGSTIDATGYSTAITVAARDFVTVFGVTLMGASDGIRIRTGSKSVTVDKVNVRGNEVGIRVSDSSHVVVRGTRIGLNRSYGVVSSKSELRLVDSLVTRNGGDGLLAGENSSVTLERVSFWGNGKNGVNLRGGKAVLRNVDVEGNRASGLRARDNTSLVGSMVLATRNKEAGLSVLGGSLALTGLQSTANGQQGAIFSATTISVADVDMSDNGGQGINAEQSELRIEGARLQNNQREGLLAKAAGSVQVMQAVIIGNGGEGIRVEASGSGQVVVSRVELTDNRGHGAQLLGAATTEIRNTVASRNALAGVTLADTSASCVDVDMSDNGGQGINAEQSELRIEGARLQNNQREGLLASKTQVVSIIQSMISNNAKEGVRIRDAGGVTLRSLRVNNNRSDGVKINNTVSTDVRDTVVFSNLGHGILLADCPEPMVWNNLVYANQGNGITISGTTTGSHGARVLQNTVAFNAQRGVVVGGADTSPPSEAATVLRNIFARNGRYGLNVNRTSLPGYVGDYNLTIDPYGPLTPIGAHDVVADPIFISPAGLDGVLGREGGADDDFRLSQRAAGQAVQSPAVDAGGISAIEAEVGDKTTRTDNAPDTGIADLGYHYPIAEPGN